jgi:cell division protein FtsZ
MITNPHPPIIKVIAIGGGAQNAANRMMADGVAGVGVEFIALDTDPPALDASKAPVRVCIGQASTQGGPSVGERAAEAHADVIRRLLSGAEMVFVVAAMGGGTGSGAAPVVAHIASSVGALVIGVATMPFSFEGTPRKRNAEGGIEKLRGQVDALTVIANDALMPSIDLRASLQQMFGTSDEVMMHAVRGLSDLVVKPGLINLDIADLDALLRGKGEVMMTVTTASGEGCARAAAEGAIASPWLSRTLDGANDIVFNITGGEDMSLFEVNEIANLVRAAAHPDSRVIFGTIVDEKLQNEIRVTLFAA